MYIAELESVYPLAVPRWIYGRMDFAAVNPSPIPAYCMGYTEPE